MNVFTPAMGLALLGLLMPTAARSCLPAPNDSLLFAHYRCVAMAERQFDDPTLARSCGAVLAAITRQYDGDPDALHDWERCDVRAAARVRAQAALPDALLDDEMQAAARILAPSSTPLGY